MKAVLFDLDDTLHDKTRTLSLMAAQQHDRFDLIGLSVHPDAWRELYVQRHCVIMPKAEVFALLADDFSLPEPMTAALLSDYDRTLGSLAQPIPGMLALLEACRDTGLSLGCVTNGRDRIQRSKLDGLGITALFDAIVTSEGFGKKKPDPGIFDACLSKLGVERREAVFVGDSFSADMQPAMALGMHPIWKSKRSDSGVAFSSDSLDEIRAYIAALDIVRLDRG